ncbi:MAG: tyrosine-protein phosphatase [Frankia sp.]|nr:tyrosine-protein phosphatase [Frankia sp.]
MTSGVPAGGPSESALSALSVPAQAGGAADAAEVATLVNLRDVGGLPTSAGGQTRPGVLYRSEAPRPGDAVPDTVPVWPPRTVIDLRSGMERDEHPLAGNGTQVHVVPLLGEQLAGDAEQARSALSGGLQTLYLAMLEHCAPGLVEVLRLAAGAPGPVLVHCAVGKDRTGVSVALLLRAAGVTRQAVLADYLATGPNMPGVLRRLGYRAVLPDQMLDVVPGSQEALRRELAAVNLAAATAVLDVVDSHPGGAAGWLLSHGAEDDTLAAWQSRILAN